MTTPVEAMAALFDAIPSNDLPEGPNFNVCPTTQVHVVVSGEGTRRLTQMRWGFLPHWYKTETAGPLLINARSETLAEKPAFRAAARARRCLIPATGFYEWTKDEDGNRLPWYIFDPSGSPLVFAGVWQNWGADAISTCAIVTTEASEKMQAIHHREPVTLAPDDFALWLGEEGHGASTLMKAAPDERMSAYRVDPEVNSNRAHGEHLINPLS